MPEVLASSTDGARMLYSNVVAREEGTSEEALLGPSESRGIEEVELGVVEGGGIEITALEASSMLKCRCAFVREDAKLQVG